jgi:hypothetical protein
MTTALPHPVDVSRLLSAVMAFELGKDMATCGVWMMEADSLMGRIGSLSSSPRVFAYAWMALALLVLPFFVLQVTGWGKACRRILTRLALWALLCSGVFWTYLAFLSKNLDYASVTSIFLLHGTTCIAMAAILAYGLNAAQLQRMGVAA